MENFGFEFSPAGGFIAAGLTLVVVVGLAFVARSIYKSWKK